METKKIEQKPMKWYWWAIIVVISMALGAGCRGEKVVTKEITKEVTKECDYSNWQALKVKDDEIILLAGKGFTVVSEIFGAASRLDTTTMTRKTTEFEAMADQMIKLAPERLTILKQLGY
jgi:hypothetical protein